MATKLYRAPVYIGAIDAYRINHYWKKGMYFLENTHDILKQNGMPEDELEQIMEAAIVNSQFSFPHAELTILQAGQIVRLGDHDYQVILTAGHTDGHICFYNEEYSMLLSGDHLLQKITSNISQSSQPDADPNPLDNYLRALNNIRGLNCKLVLPAHGKPFSNFEERISQLESHHQKRLALIKNCVGSGATAYNVCRLVFTKELNYQGLRLAMSETLAHLVYLLFRGDLKVVSTDGIKSYHLKE
ncbi:MAG: MBL fold metallo-hydrolase [Desulfitobacteriaceae bacterium]